MPTWCHYSILSWYIEAGMNEVETFLQTTFSNVFYWDKPFTFWFLFHLSFGQISRIAQDPSTKTRSLTGPTMSDTWLTVVPEAAPRYSTLLPGLIWMASTPPKMAAANLDRNGFQARYSNLISPSWIQPKKQWWLNQGIYLFPQQ